jgi:hypothetical protein
MKGCGMGESGRMRKRRRQAAKPTTKTDKTCLRASCANKYSNFRKSPEPALGAQKATAMMMSVNPASMSRSEGPDGAPCANIVTAYRTPVFAETV